MKHAKTIALAGNPNSGKTTLFNALTGARQKVGNWPGVTVERKSGVFEINDKTIQVVDLPGTYSLVAASLEPSLDEKIALEYVLSSDPDVIVNVVDASNLERNLYLTMQLLEMQKPMIVVLTMMDVVKQKGWKVNVAKLTAKLGCPVVAVEAFKKEGSKTLKTLLDRFDNEKPVPAHLTAHTIHPSQLHDKLKQFVEDIYYQIPQQYQAQAQWFAIRLLEDDSFVQQFMQLEVQQKTLLCQQDLKEAFQEDSDILFADTRYRYINDIIKTCLQTSSQKAQSWTQKIDNIILNRVLGIPIFLGIMYTLFLFAINIGGAFQDFFDISSNTVFVQGFAHVLMNLRCPDWLIAILANGAGRGINTTVTFIPVIGAMFLFLAFLEDSGYMARAAFVVDRGMRALGLPGKAFVPMIVGFGCNVPAVMATRTLENKRDRILTIMMSPFMSCGARLAIYAVFTAAFFPVGSQNVVFSLYLIGILMAVLTGLLLRKTFLKGDPAPLILEMPAYHLPHVKTLFIHAWQRLKGFVFRAGKLIVPICIVLGVLTSLNTDGTLNVTDGDAHSLLAALGKFITPVFSPMGIHQDNWPATVGLATGVLAKEVVVGTLNALYTQLGHLSVLQMTTFSFWNGLQEALFSIPQNFSQLGSVFSNPILAQAPVHSLNQSVYGFMYQKFDGQIGAMAYLLFVLLYFPCVSTTAAMVRELNRAWTVFSVLWSTGIAYGVAVFFYQAATFAKHPLSSSCWLVGIATTLLLTIFTMRHYGKQTPTYKKLLPSGEVV